ncbi:hypothetical protein [Croceibacterium aestuarii]|uniref:hypothetical protein n=1 Tax=Croceibacterium aestuarii TaxID=3064139 RepID=UPI00272E531B|nr:hypothetical protein [Croceibacterium sp. D39]
MIPNAECGTCAFWNLAPLVKRADGIAVGECRGLAPKLIQTADMRQHASFPLMRQGEWCGEHATIAEGEIQ